MGGQKRKFGKPESYQLHQSLADASKGTGGEYFDLDD